MIKTLDFRLKEAALTISVRHLLPLRKHNPQRTARRILSLYSEVYGLQVQPLLAELTALLETEGESEIEAWLSSHFTC